MVHGSKRNGDIDWWIGSILYSPCRSNYFICPIYISFNTFSINWNHRCNNFNCNSQLVFRKSINLEYIGIGVICKWNIRNKSYVYGTIIWNLLFWDYNSSIVYWRYRYCNIFIYNNLCCTYNCFFAYSI